MDATATIRSWFRKWRHGAKRRHALHLLLGGAIAFLIAASQGLFEVFNPDHGFVESIRGINRTWLFACAVTFVAIFSTSELVWNIVGGSRTPRVALDTALTLVARSFEFPKSSNVRATVYIADRPDRLGNHILYQEFPYAFAHHQERRYGIGRNGLPEGSGIVGEAFRRREKGKNVMLVTFVDDTKEYSYVERLKRSWGFPRAVAEQIDPSRPNHLAVTFECHDLRSGNTVNGVLYIDAKGTTQRFTTGQNEAIIKRHLDLIVKHVGTFYGCETDDG